MDRRGQEKMIDNVKRMHELYLKKYEEACIFREHDKAIMYQGYLNALEHLLIEAGEVKLIDQRRSKIEKLRNIIVELWIKEG